MPGIPAAIWVGALIGGVFAGTKTRYETGDWGQTLKATGIGAAAGAAGGAAGGALAGGGAGAGSGALSGPFSAGGAGASGAGSVFGAGAGAGAGTTVGAFGSAFGGSSVVPSLALDVPAGAAVGAGAGQWAGTTGGALGSSIAPGVTSGAASLGSQAAAAPGGINWLKDVGIPVALQAPGLIGSALAGTPEFPETPQFEFPDFSPSQVAQPESATSAPVIPPLTRTVVPNLPRDRSPDEIDLANRLRREQEARFAESKALAGTSQLAAIAQGHLYGEQKLLKEQDAENRLLGIGQQPYRYRNTYA